MKLKSIDGKVPYIMAAGKDFVKDEMSLAAEDLFPWNTDRQQALSRFPHLRRWQVLFCWNLDKAQVQQV